MCRSSHTVSYCCNDQSRTECKQNENITCSLYSTNTSVTILAMCPRDPVACGGTPPVLTPLLNQNQSVLVTQMNGTLNNVCTWELKVDQASFLKNHP